MSNKKTIHVAIVDSCEFTMIGLQYLVNRDNDMQQDVFFHGFTNIEDLALSKQCFDIIIYDPLNTRHFRVTTNDDILCIKEKQPGAKIYIYSLSVGYLKFKHVDGVISKRVSLGDIKALWQILMSQTPQESGLYKVSMTTRQRTQARLSSEEASVLRGYSCNLKTKQIARQLGCNVRLVYFYKNNAMNKLKAVRGPSFYQSIRWILN